jgi:hypothetical protein
MQSKRAAFVAALIPLLMFCGRSRADETPAKPRTVTKVTAKGVDGDKDVSILIDVTDVPEAKEWATAAADYGVKLYPKLVKELPSDGYQAPREMTLLLKRMKGVAYTSGTTITVSAAYIKDHPKDLGMVAHEMVHVVQQYHHRENPGWLVEGIADYIRYYVVEPGSKQGAFNADRSSYKGGYQPAAGLLNWIEKKKPGAVVKLSQHMREGKYTPEAFKELCGGDPDELWEQFKKEQAK